MPYYQLALLPSQPCLTTSSPWDLPTVPYYQPCLTTNRALLPAAPRDLATWVPTEPYDHGTCSLVLYDLGTCRPPEPLYLGTCRARLSTFHLSTIHLSTCRAFRSTYLPTVLPAEPLYLSTCRAFGPRSSPLYLTIHHSTKELAFVPFYLPSLSIHLPAYCTTRGLTTSRPRHYTRISLRLAFGPWGFYQFAFLPVRFSTSSPLYQEQPTSRLYQAFGPWAFYQPTFLPSPRDQRTFLPSPRLWTLGFRPARLSTSSPYDQRTFLPSPFYLLALRPADMPTRSYQFALRPATCEPFDLLALRPAEPLYLVPYDQRTFLPARLSTYRAFLPTTLELRAFRPADLRLSTCEPYDLPTYLRALRPTNLEPYDLRALRPANLSNFYLLALRPTNLEPVEPAEIF